MVSDTAAKDIFPKCVTNSQTHVSHTPQNITAQQHGIGFGDGNFSHIVIISNPNLSRVLLLGDRRKVSGSLQKTNLSHEGSIFLRRKKVTQNSKLGFFYSSPKHCKNCECCPVSLLIVRSQRLSEFRFSIRIVISVPNINSPGFSLQLSKC